METFDLEQSANQMHDEAQDREERDDIGTHDDEIHVHRKILTASQQKEADEWQKWFDGSIAEENARALEIKNFDL